MHFAAKSFVLTGDFAHFILGSLQRKGQQQILSLKDICLAKKLTLRLFDLF